MPDLNMVNLAEWPYPVNYGKENIADADVIILGGGIAGCHAAVHAARRGAKVVVVTRDRSFEAVQEGPASTTGTPPVPSL